MGKLRLQPSDRVFCPRLGEGEFEILSEKPATREYRVKSVKTGVEQSVLKIHCEVPHDLMMHNMRMRQQRKLERAQQIGNSTPKKK